MNVNASLPLLPGAASSSPASPVSPGPRAAGETGSVRTSDGQAATGSPADGTFLASLMAALSPGSPATPSDGSPQPGALLAPDGTVASFPADSEQCSAEGLGAERPAGDLAGTGRRGRLGADGGAEDTVGAPGSPGPVATGTPTAAGAVVSTDLPVALAAALGAAGRPTISADPAGIPASPGADARSASPVSSPATGPALGVRTDSGAAVVAGSAPAPAQVAAASRRPHISAGTVPFENLGGALAVDGLGPQAPAAQAPAPQAPAAQAPVTAESAIPTSALGASETGSQAGSTRFAGEAQAAAAPGPRPAHGPRPAPAGAGEETQDGAVLPGSQPAAGTAQRFLVGPIANAQPGVADVNDGPRGAAASSDRPSSVPTVSAPAAPGARTAVEAPVTDAAEADPAPETSQTVQSGSRPVSGRHAEAGVASQQPEPATPATSAVDARMQVAQARQAAVHSSSSSQAPQTEAARRVLEVVDRMGGDTAPSRVLVDLPQLGGMRLEVSMRGQSVHLSVVEPGSHGGSQSDLVTFGREVAAGLADKGFDLTGFGSRGGSQQGAGSWADDRRQGPPPGNAWSQAQKRRTTPSSMLHI